MPRGEFDRSERRARTRVQLLDAAARVYARRGFDSATLDEVAEEAGFTKGAVYDHFGSKEKLLSALLGEHLNAQIAEQIELFDPATETAERPRAGADRWMRELEEDPNAFRLFVEAWVHGQRDEELREIVAEGMEAWRATFRSFGAQRTEELGDDAGEAMLEQVATVMLALGTGLGMVKLADPASVSPRLLGAVNVLLLRALETSPEARELLADVSRALPRP
ncbi:MAG: TetR/AcrR family transcriptional regulator [Actinomycetota bacterium]|nr:TetR/AcrR family transcriptional regulator [Actinomycetota bacterium]